MKRGCAARAMQAASSRLHHRVILAFRQGQDRPSAEVLISASGLLCLSYSLAESEAHAIRVAGVVIVGRPRSIDAAEVIAVVAIRETLPPNGKHGPAQV